MAEAGEAEQVSGDQTKGPEVSEAAPEGKIYKSYFLMFKARAARRRLRRVGCRTCVTRCFPPSRRTSLPNFQVRNYNLIMISFCSLITQAHVMTTSCYER